MEEHQRQNFFKEPRQKGKIWGQGWGGGWNKSRFLKSTIKKKGILVNIATFSIMEPVKLFRRKDNIETCKKN